MIKKIQNLKFIICNGNKGMTYVELIVVLSIFGIMSSVVLVNYKDYSSQIDVKTLANDIALKVVEAQKSATSGKLAPAGHNPQVVDWKPSFGIYFKSGLTLGKDFVYFTDLYNAGYCDNSCDTPTSGADYLDTINLSKGNYIKEIKVFDSSNNSQQFSNLSIIFTRSSSGMSVATYNGTTFTPLSGVYYVLITVSSPSAITSSIEIYSSGRIQIK